MAFSVVGKGLPRIDGASKVRGGAVFGADVKLPGMLIGVFLPSPHAHARIRHIDTYRAEGLPGVKGVVTAQDAPSLRYCTPAYGPSLCDRTFMARSKVRYFGEPVAAVAAVDEETAREALSLIAVEYEEIPAAFTIPDALLPDAPLVHEELLSYQGVGREARGNIYLQRSAARGDVSRGFTESDFVFEHTFATPMVHQSYVEPHAMVAAVDDAGRATVWTTTQAPFNIRSDLATILQMPLSQIRVVPLEVGGGFGGKLFTTLEPICLLLARKARRPVRMVMSREEEFLIARPRAAVTARLKTGVKRDGTLVAREGEFYFDTGAYQGAPVSFGVRFGLGPYRIPNAKADAYGVYTNKVSAGYFRAPGAPQVTFASESQMDIIARELGIDPWEVRWKNAWEEGDESVTGERMGRIGLKKTLEEVRRRGMWRADREVGRGRGLACGQWYTGGGATSACVTIYEDGTVGLLTGAIDITGSRTGLVQILAEELGVAPERIVVPVPDTDTIPWTGETSGSRITYGGGAAVLQAARDVKGQILGLVAEKLEVSAEDLELGGGRVYVKGSREKSLSLGEVALAAQGTKVGALLGWGVVGRLSPAPVFATQVAEVQVDAETGQVEVLKLGGAQDVGFAVNPLSVAGQMEGGMAQGMGYGIMEAMIFFRGKVENPNFADGKVPTAADVPSMATAIVEEPSDGPLGVRGVGEMPIVPTAAAIANAIHDAAGVRIRELPVTPERVVAAVKEKRG
ncbi:MAG: xanthine dehydrogenase family protein molybdopterin-binding subunit [Chloroflexi bacterium]|nr:xanthine dehydrogenase family protein molybdopterin-binding subunit [Chloroflexota bacterium]